MTGKELQENDQQKTSIFKARHTLAFMGFLAFACLYAFRVNLSVAIVAMAKKPHRVQEDVALENCPYPNDFNTSSNYLSSEGEFEWDEKIQGIILGSFFYVYGLTNVIGGHASHHFGGRLVVGFGIIMTAVLTLLTPVAARLSTGFLIALRVLEGCFEGLAYPAINTLIAKWYPTNERSKYASIIFAGMPFGTVITMSATGWLCASSILGGWPSVFYICGVLGIIWGFFWFLLISEDPQKHPGISRKELKYIMEGCPDAQERLPVPWRSIFKSRYFWTIVVMHVGYNWGYYIMLTELPTYLDKILHVHIKNNGIMSAMPYLAYWLFSIFYGILISKAIANGTFTILFVRKLSMIFAGYGPMICLLAMCFVNCNASWAFTVLVLSGAANGAMYCGLLSSHADISPRFAGILLGLTNAIGTIPGFVGPAVTGILTENNQTIWAWRTVFLICALIYGVSTTIYLLFITTECQPWNDPKVEYKKDKESTSVALLSFKKTSA